MEGSLGVGVGVGAVVCRCWCVLGNDVGLLLALLLFLRTGNTFV